MLPEGFVYVKDYIPTLIESLFYFSDFNFMGRPAAGYKANKVILTLAATAQLQKAAADFANDGWKIKVIDAYRPTKAVDDFWQWALDQNDTKMKDIFYPEFEDKTLIFDGYLAKYSSHSRGSAVDLTLVKDGKEIDMGSQIDLLGTISNTISDKITQEQQQNRLYMRDIMHKHGYDNYRKEWWHYALLNEPFPRNPEDHLNFDVE
ncbi:MAG: M15 family metallopeptidase [Rickettsiales bacterium]